MSAMGGKQMLGCPLLCQDVEYAVRVECPAASKDHSEQDQKVAKRPVFADVEAVPHEQVGED